MNTQIKLFSLLGGLLLIIGNVSYAHPHHDGFHDAPPPPPPPPMHHHRFGPPPPPPMHHPRLGPLPPPHHIYMAPHHRFDPPPPPPPHHSGPHRR